MDSDKRTTNMTAAEAVDFLNVWGEAELRKVTDMSAPANQTPPAASTVGPNLGLDACNRQMRLRDREANR